MSYGCFNNLSLGLLPCSYRENTNLPQPAILFLELDENDFNLLLDTGDKIILDISM